jgi:hypothetical protein
MTKFGLCLVSLWLLWHPGVNASAGSVDGSQFVRVSEVDARYFEFIDGQPYIPVGLNMLQAYPAGDPAAHMKLFEEWMKALSEQGGNFIRVWLSSSFWEVEHETSGVYDEEKAKRIDALIELAKKYKIRVKLTLEHFRYLDLDHQRWAGKPMHTISQGGPASDIADFFDGEAGRASFRQKMNWFAQRFGDNPNIFGWELWNEINAVSGGDYMSWTEVMLPALQRAFPKNLNMQSLGSFDADHVVTQYRRMSTMEGNDVAQVHRYLDLGASLEVCKGPVDVLAADAVRELRSYHPGRPILLAESGAVEPNHAGPFLLYGKDKEGIILHDVLFAPFFAGAAGAGQIWHWDHYVARNKLWWQFGRFAETVKGINPAEENFEPLMLEHRDLRVYVLKGKNTMLLWCRDRQNTWRTELKEGVPPETKANITLELGSMLPHSGTTHARSYDPWRNHWADLSVTGTVARLPDFKRSIVVRLAY